MDDRQWVITKNQTGKLRNACTFSHCWFRSSLVTVGTGQSLDVISPSTFSPSVSTATNEVNFDAMLPWRLTAMIFCLSLSISLPKENPANHIFICNYTKTQLLRIKFLFELFHYPFFFSLLPYIGSLRIPMHKDPIYGSKEKKYHFPMIIKFKPTSQHLPWFKFNYHRQISSVFIFVFYFPFFSSLKGRNHRVNIWKLVKVLWSKMVFT